MAPNLLSNLDSLNKNYNENDFSIIDEEPLYIDSVRDSLNFERNDNIFKN